ncbi:MAG TPA: phosphate regulon sensor histidine kinase PhoR [Rhodanobacteraceae bacterium]|nr:phosphate regulon sensor histidine kinase PhoR [Rhodanobacteraceae bacterium]
MSFPDHTREQRLLAQIRNLRRAVGALPDAAVLLDRRGCIHWANPAAERLLGVHRKRDHGKSMATLLGDSALGQWLRSNSDHPPADIPAPTDPERHLSITLMPFGGDQRVLLARDISHISRLEKMRRDFVANVSHELRTPLTVIHGYLELFDPDDMPDLAPALTEMRAQSRRMGQIVEDLLTLSRLETQQHLPDEHVSMTDMLISLGKEAEALSKGRHRISVHHEASVDLRGSQRDLHSAFSNLVSNAVRYTPEHGEILIRWQLTPEGAAYSVRDTGYGIPSEHLGRLSERFYRVSSSRSRDKGGTGLGLSIVKHVLNLHQARLKIESEPGKGSVFTCLFDNARLLPPTRGAD